MSGLKLRGIRKSFGAVEVIKGVDLDIDDEEFVVFVGPSGCGKSTLLRAVNLLNVPARGSVMVRDGERIVDVVRCDADTLRHIRQTRVAMVFQQFALLPWRTVMDNVLLPAEVQGLPKAQATVRARELLAMVGLDEFENKYPMELSGGMQQRAAISRALIGDPGILLMDEPFGALDAMTREQMNLDLQRIWQESGKTVVLITHSIPEAVFLADRVVVLTARPGRIARIVDVPLPRPRGLDVMEDPLFGRLTGEIRRLLYGRTNGSSKAPGGDLS